MFLKIIACEVAFREICWTAAQSRNLVEFDFLSQGYHDNSDIGRQRLQERIDNLPEGKFDAVLLGYALCNNMTVGLQARHVPLVIPRAHDCITFFLGSRERYAQLFKNRPGTFYYTSGWLEHRERGGERVPWQQGAQMGPGRSYQELIDKYGEEAASYVMDVLGGWVRDYSHGTLINFDFTANLQLPERVREICRQNNWQFEEIPGDLGLLRRWLDGDWATEDFLVVHPGERVVATYDERVISSEPVPGAATDTHPRQQPQPPSQGCSAIWDDVKAHARRHQE